MIARMFFIVVLATLGMNAAKASDVALRTLPTPAPLELGKIESLLVQTRDQVCPQRRDGVQCMTEYAVVLLSITQIENKFAEVTLAIGQNDIASANKLMRDMQTQLTNFNESVGGLDKYNAAPTLSARY